MTANVKNLPHLLNLLDDETPMVRDAVRNALAAFGDRLDEELDRLEPPPTNHQRRTLHALLLPRRQEALAEAWLSWTALPDPYRQLECAYQMIATYLEPSSTPPRLPELLDEVADAFRADDRPVTVRALAEFLFQEQGFRGAHVDYYSPENSNLVHVLRTRRGIPLSLTCLFMLVGHRLGLAIQGCNFPGHFLARVFHGRERIYIDTFDRGRILTEADLVKVHGEAVRDSLRADTPPKVILERMLRNLIQAFRKHGDSAQADFLLTLLDTTRRATTPTRQA